MFQLLVMTWTAQPFTDEQLLVVRDAAAQMLKLEDGEERVTFTHPDLEGEILCEGWGRIGSMPGTCFHADCGLVRGERWTIDFILPRGSEHIKIDHNSIVLSTKHKRLGESDYVLEHSLVRVPKGLEDEAAKFVDTLNHRPWEL